MNLLLRADSSPAVGAGHVMRCLALAQACLARGGTAAFATTEAGSRLFRSAALAEMTVVPISPDAEGPATDAEATAEAARSRGADWVVLDGYRFDADYQSAIAELGGCLLVLDDFGHAESYPADLVLNQNLHADAALYEPGRDPRHLLLGPRYALLRREFGPWRERRREIPDRANKVLVTLGGGESGEPLSKVLASLIALERPEIEVRCLIGPLAERATRIQELASSADFRISFETAGVEMPELMAWADLAVSGGGSTCWELAYMGLPALTVALNAHQASIAASLEEAGTALFAGAAEGVRRRDLSTLLTELLDNAELRRRMSTLGRELVDGRGAERVLHELETRLTGEES